MTPEQYWSVYSDLRDAVDQDIPVGRLSNGLEMALSELLERYSENILLTSEQVKVKFAQRVNTFSCREARHERINIGKAGQLETAFDEESRVVMACSLTEVFALLSDGELELIEKLALGYSYEEIAGSHKTGALRTRISRIRHRLRSAA